MNSNNNPKWIESKLFVDALRESVGDFKEIQHFKVSNALGPGENYATIVLRVQIDYLLPDDSRQSQSFILKVAHENEWYRQHVAKWEMFKKEAMMYTDTVPELEELYRSKGLEVRFAAKSYNLPVNEEYILLEDLSHMGFRNVKRQDCFDMQHTKKSLKKLAQWHAASAVRVEKKGSYGPLFHGFLIEETKEMTEQMFGDSLKYVLAAVRKIPNNQEYYGKLESYFSRIGDVIYKERLTECDDNEFLALNHGDFWSNNIMFQYEQGGDDDISETYFVDLQVASYGSVTQDLMYFIMSSAHLEIKIKCFDELIRYYHHQLVEHLKFLEYSKPLPNLRELHTSLIKKSAWGIFTVCSTLAGILCDPTDVASMENFLNDSEDGETFRQMLYFNERYIQHLEVILPWLNNRGAFE